MAWRSATAGHSTRSPSTPSSGSSVTRPGRSSSIGKASTSVGPSLSIHCSLSWAMVASSTILMHSSASGCTRIRSITKRESRESSWASTSVPDSFRTSMLMGASCLRSSGAGVTAARFGPRFAGVGGAGLVLVVRRDDVPHEAVPDHVVRGQPVERDVLDAVEDVLDDAQTALGARGQVDLGDVTGDDHLGTEAEPGEEHLHLLGRG